MLTYVDFIRPDREDIAWRQLLTALGAPPVQEPPEPPKREEWCLKHPYPMPPNFTGRVAEREMLTRWLTDDGDHPLLVLRALGGFGKSALCWHWLLHDVDPAQFPRVVWWSFYEGDASFDSFLRETLEYLLRATHLPGASLVALGPRQQADELLRLLHQPGTLLVLDGFERALRAYSSMNAAYQGDEPLQPPGPPLSGVGFSITTSGGYLGIISTWRRSNAQVPRLNKLDPYSGRTHAPPEQATSDGAGAVEPWHGCGPIVRFDECLGCTGDPAEQEGQHPSPTTARRV
jgi:hypothetical protein